MRIFEDAIQSINQQVLSMLSDRGITEPASIDWNSIPLVNQWGLGTSVCLKAAAFLQRSGKNSAPVARQAQELAEQLAAGINLPAGFARVEASRGYLNIFFDTPQYVQKVLETVFADGPDYGRGLPKGERVMVEYAQPNTHHSFHIGHFRNAVLGEALARLVEFAGFETIRASYPGDIGLGVVRCMWAYQKFHAGEEPSDVLERGRWLGQVYTEASSLLEPKPDETDAQRRSARDTTPKSARCTTYGTTATRRFGSCGNAHANGAWTNCRRFFKQLDIAIDVFFYESEADEPGKAIVDELIARKIAEDERPTGGPVIVRIDEKLGLTRETYRIAVILRSDGTSLYLTKDLALAKIKFEQYHVDRSIYVVDYRQSLHFQQAFKILELWGFPQASKCYHLAYGIVTLPEGTMSSRKGNMVFYLDVVQEARARIQAIIAEKNPELAGANREKTAWQVGLGALKYAMLSVDNTKQIIFSWESALSFDGQAAPYIQYAHVRAGSILSKAENPPQPVLPRYDLHPAEITLIEWMLWQGYSGAHVRVLDVRGRLTVEAQRSFPGKDDLFGVVDGEHGVFERPQTNLPGRLIPYRPG